MSEDNKTERLSEAKSENSGVYRADSLEENGSEKADDLKMAFLAETSSKKTNDSKTEFLAEPSSEEANDFKTEFSAEPSSEEANDFKMQKYAILTVSGQSNALGYDESKVEETDYYSPHPRIKQLGLYGEHNLQVIPLTYSPEDAQDMRDFSHPESPDKPGTKGVHLPLARLLLPELPEDYQLLVIPVAYGGTYFGSQEHDDGDYDPEAMKDAVYNAKLRWGVHSSYYRMLKDRLNYVLSWNESNIYLGNIWIQGESDAANGTVEVQKQEFETLLNDFVQYFDQHYSDRITKPSYRDLWFVVESSSFWQKMPAYQDILANYRRLLPETFIDIPIDTDTNRIGGTGRTTSLLDAHFGNNTLATEVAPRIYQKMKEQLNK